MDMYISIKKNILKFIANIESDSMERPSSSLDKIQEYKELNSDEKKFLEDFLFGVELHLAQDKEAVYASLDNPESNWLGDSLEHLKTKGVKNKDIRLIIIFCYLLGFRGKKEEYDNELEKIAKGYKFESEFSLLKESNDSDQKEVRKVWSKDSKVWLYLSKADIFLFILMLLIFIIYIYVAFQKIKINIPT